MSSNKDIEQLVTAKLAQYTIAEHGGISYQGSRKQLINWLTNLVLEKRTEAKREGRIDELMKITDIPLESLEAPLIERIRNHIDERLKKLENQ